RSSTMVILRMVVSTVSTPKLFSRSATDHVRLARSPGQAPLMRHVESSAQQWPSLDMNGGAVAAPIDVSRAFLDGRVDVVQPLFQAERLAGELDRAAPGFEAD